jgi:hypothetical protein
MRNLIAISLFTFGLCLFATGCKKKQSTTTSQSPMRATASIAQPAANKYAWPHEKLTVDAIAFFNETAEVMESVRDPKSGRVAIPKLEKVFEKYANVLKQFAETPELPQEEEAALDQKYGAQMERAMNRLKTAARHAKADGGPEFDKEMKRFDERMKNKGIFGN